MLERGQKTVGDKLDHQAAMFSTETASMLVEFAEKRGGDKITFLGHEVGKPSDIAKHKGQGSSEGGLCFHLSHSQPTFPGYRTCGSRSSVPGGVRGNEIRSQP